MAALARRAIAKAAPSRLGGIQQRALSVAALPPAFVRDADSKDLSLRLVDCADGPSYVRAHIPGATILPVSESLKDPRNPTFVIAPTDFDALAEALGVGANSHVVFYDQNGGLASSRAWWVFKYYGHANVSVLDGGWQGYARTGAPVSVNADDRFPPDVPADHRLKAQPQPQLLATLQEIAEGAEGGASTSGKLQVLDARSPGEYEGSDTRGNRYGGHVPGALNLPFNKVFDPATGQLLPVDELRRLFESAGLRQDVRTVTYCQAGVRAAVAAMALSHAGFSNVALYDGSMKEYNNSEKVPRQSGSKR